MAPRSTRSGRWGDLVTPKSEPAAGRRQWSRTDSVRLEPPPPLGPPTRWDSGSVWIFLPPPPHTMTARSPPPPMASPKKTTLGMAILNPARPPNPPSQKNPQEAPKRLSGPVIHQERPPATVQRDTGGMAGRPPEFVAAEPQPPARRLPEYEGERACGKKRGNPQKKTESEVWWWCGAGGEGKKEHVNDVAPSCVFSAPVGCFADTNEMT